MPVRALLAANLAHHFFTAVSPYNDCQAATLSSVLYLRKAGCGSWYSGNLPVREHLGNRLAG